MVSLGRRLRVVRKPSTIDVPSSKLTVIIFSIHDIPLAMSATKDVRFPNDPTVGQGESYGTARGRAASKHSHCWAYVQGLCRVRDCPYLHPEAVQLCTLLLTIFVKCFPTDIALPPSCPAHTVSCVAELHQRPPLCIQAPRAIDSEAARDTYRTSSSASSDAAAVASPVVPRAGDSIRHCAVPRDDVLPCRLGSYLRTCSSPRASACSSARTSSCTRSRSCTGPCTSTAPALEHVQPPLHVELSKLLTSCDQRGLRLLAVFSRVGDLPLAVLRNDLEPPGLVCSSCVQRTRVRRAAQRQRCTDGSLTAHTGACNRRARGEGNGEARRVAERR